MIFEFTRNVTVRTTLQIMDKLGLLGLQKSENFPQHHHTAAKKESLISKNIYR